MKPKDEKKLDAIIATTCRLAAERSLFGLTLTDIAKAAGIATSTLYVYFDDKEALFNEVYRRAKREAVAFYSVGVDADTPLKMRVRCLWNRVLDHRLQRYDQVCFMEQFVGSPMMNDDIRAYIAQVSEGLMQIVGEGQREEILKPVPVPFLYSLFMGSVRATAQLFRAEGIADTEENRAIAFQLCWDGVRC